MDKPIFDLLTELIVKLDTMIANADKKDRVALQTRSIPTAAFYQGASATCRNLAAWAREKLKASTVVEDLL